MVLIDSLRTEIDSWLGNNSQLIAVTETTSSVSRDQARELIYQLVRKIEQLKRRMNKRLNIGLCFTNPVHWITSTLALQLSDAVSVPIPLEFSKEQIASFVPNLDIIFFDSHLCAERLASISQASIEMELIDSTSIYVKVFERSLEAKDLPFSASKVIHTSGSTNSPKGVVISHTGLASVLESMMRRLEGLGSIHYVSVMPYSLLLEQVLGIYLPVISKGSISVLPDSVAPYTGVQKSILEFVNCIRESKANMAMVPPSFLLDLAKLSISIKTNLAKLLGSNLKVLATGGAPIATECLEEFRKNGVEIYQGYGLSENSSVVSWNYPGPNKLGSVGKPLDHNKVRITADGRIEVSGDSLFMGYIDRGNFTEHTENWLDTGDIGIIDDDGYLTVTGRDSNIIVLSNGRNITPEWIETPFKSIPGVRDAVAVGHGKQNLSILLLLDSMLSFDGILRQASMIAKELSNSTPEFARVHRILPVSFEEHFYSVSGRILRNKVLNQYSNLISQSYETEGELI